MTTFLSVLFTCVAVVCGSLAAETPSRQQPAKKPPKRHVIYQVPKTAIHYCSDQQEAKRRWTTTKEMSSADVFRFSGAPASKRLDPILRASPLSEFGGGTDAEPMQFGADVTDDEDKVIRDALAKGELFIIYYHYGW